ncbi:hypothetical protein AQUSIP_08960 [Aquicella siphonis]|uniref:SET domain-containing protein n=1 Tax=Aquicella siphonis TaxID=254247 RepID=A0A5E4PGX1_9COXI|nr:SET domain-containing protein-lysine N-methyltransferase [Aquicella siphonis]VVC75606.1 hypothetical protein AQUSIP_08960 [Aquicella siphonis]
MKSKLFQNKLAVKKSPMHGYGVFAEKTIRKGEKIEECYMIVSRGGDKKLEDYYFDANGKYAIFTGFGIIYNHSDDPNADYKINMKSRVVTFKAVRTIHKGEEIFVSYGDEWFSSRGLKPKAHRKK